MHMYACIEKVHLVLGIDDRAVPSTNSQTGRGVATDMLLNVHAQLLGVHGRREQKVIMISHHALQWLCVSGLLSAD